MDPHKQQLSNMDPKLKEAYERVMNTPAPSSPAPHSPGIANTSTTDTISKPGATTPDIPLSKIGITHPMPGVTAPIAPPTTPVSSPLPGGPASNPATPHHAMSSQFDVPHAAPPQPKMVTETIATPPPIPPGAPTPAAGLHTITGQHQTPGTVHIGYNTKPNQKISLEKKKLGIPPALYIVGCIVFFILYTLFWVKVFGVKVPFLPI